VSKTPEPSGPPDSRLDKHNADEFWRLMTRYAPAIGLVPASVFAGYMIGYGLDYLFSTTFLRFVFLILGVVSGIVQLIRILSRDME
jgi:F0F1-type ATP synthase assembly protein I